MRKPFQRLIRSSLSESFLIWRVCKLLIITIAITLQMTSQLFAAGKPVAVSVKPNNQVIIKLNAEKNTDPEIIELSNPTRLVLDFSGKYSAKNSSLAGNKETIKAVRIGQYPDKVRVVVDINAEKIPQHSQQFQGEDFVISFASQQVSAETKSSESSTRVGSGSLAVPQNNQADSHKKQTASSKLDKADNKSEVKIAVAKTPAETETKAHKTENAKTIEESKTPAVKASLAATPAETNKLEAKLTEESEAKVKAANQIHQAEEHNLNAEASAAPTMHNPALHNSSPLPTFSNEQTGEENSQQAPEHAAKAEKPTVNSAALNSKSENAAATPAVKAAEASPTVSLPPGLWIKKITFDYLPPTQTPVAKLEMTQVAKFMLKKHDDKLYTLTVSDAQLAGKNLELPHYPPQDFLGFTLIKAQSKKGEVEVQIGTERGVKLMAYYKDSAIWIRVLNR